jgi:hypothetical protein
MADNAYLAFVKDPDQTSRRAELAAFFGPRPEKFLKVYDNMASVANREPGTKAQIKFFDGGFCWPAFFLGPIWMFYRKMWVYAGIVLAIFFIFTFLPLPPGAGIGLAVAMAFAGARLYVTYAISTVSKLRGDPARIAAAGGVSPLAGWVSGIIYVLIVGYLIIHMANFARANRGSSPPPSMNQTFGH